MKKQQLNKMLIQPAMKEACYVLERLLHAGFSAFFVGGAVRDTILQRPIHDIDIATSALPEQVISLFPHTIPTGLQHGTVTVIEQGVSYEITTFRQETRYVDFRRPEEVFFVTDLYEDLKRRDFTMNAMAIDIDWNLIDPFSGREHLANQLLMTVGSSEERFHEDALRMLRAIRFAAVYELVIDPQCMKAIAAYKQLLQHVAMERVANEISRLLMAYHPERAIHLLLKSELLLHCKEQLYIAKVAFTIDKYRRNNGLTEAVPQTEQHQKRQEMREQESQLDQQYYAKQVPWFFLFYLVGVSAEEAGSDMRKLRLSKRLISETKALLELMNWLEQLQITSEDNAQIRPIAPHSGIGIEWILKLTQYSQNHISRFVALQGLAHVNHRLLTNLHHRLCIHSIKQLKVSGYDLIKWLRRDSGAWVKECLEYIFVKVASGQLINEKTEIKKFVLYHMGGDDSHGGK